MKWASMRHDPLKRSPSPSTNSENLATSPENPCVRRQQMPSRACASALSTTAFLPPLKASSTHPQLKAQDIQLLCDRPHTISHNGSHPGKLRPPNRFAATDRRLKRATHPHLSACGNGGPPRHSVTSSRLRCFLCCHVGSRRRQEGPEGQGHQQGTSAHAIHCTPILLFPERRTTSS